MVILKVLPLHLYVMLYQFRSVLFLARPLIPPWASGPALVVIGVMMAKGIKDINWEYLGDAVPSFLTIAIMPLTYNIAYGTIAGIGSYIVINTFVWLIEKVSFGRISLEKSKKDPWGNFSFGPGGEGLVPPWFVPVVYKIRGIKRTEKIKESLEERI